MAAHKHLALVLTLALSGVAAACGGGATPNPDTPADQAGGDAKPAEGGDAKPAEGGDAKPAEGGDAKPADAVKPDGGEAKPADAGKPSTPIRASQMLADVKKIGLNPDKLSALSKIGLSQKKKLMPLFQKALGYKDCQGCHVENDYKAETRNMKITRGMWDHFVVTLRDEKGGAIFCDTCHDGTAKNLNHGDKKALEKFMDEEYEDKLTRADKKDMECGTCHGDPFEGDIVTKVWGIAKN